VSRGVACDGVEDCEDGSDEGSCFACGNGTSVEVVAICDGDDDCGNGADEAECFDCGDDSLVPAENFCDGFEDCDNGSDEACFECGNGTDIVDTDVCDAWLRNELTRPTASIAATAA
jgi:hypothetical protein